MMRRRAFLGALTSPSGAVRRGVEYLQRKQSADGGWRSETYGILRAGQSLTGLVVNALLDAGAPVGEKAFSFLAGSVGSYGDDYPCYATALTLRALARTGRGGTGELVEWLIGQQMGPGNGWRPENVAYGAWGIGGERRMAPHSGHIDISMTRHVLEALAAAGVPRDAPVMRAARVFVRRCQNPDGGFYFSTVETGANKAGGFASYGTTTADGLLCQSSIGEPCGAALGWLRAHDDLGLPGGFTGEARRRYAEGLRYYYADAVTRAFRVAGVSRRGDWRGELERAQLADGSWRNAEMLVKEDDPLIATAFAVSALG